MRRIALSADDAAFSGRIANRTAPAGRLSFILVFVTLAPGVCFIVFQEPFLGSFSVSLPAGASLKPPSHKFRASTALRHVPCSTASAESGWLLAVSTSPLSISSEKGASARNH